MDLCMGYRNLVASVYPNFQKQKVCKEVLIMPSFQMLIGLPGSGKSSWIKEQHDRHSTFYKFTILSTDNHIEEHAKERGITYNEAFKSYIGIAETTMGFDLNYAIQNRNNIIWDQTNLTEKVRKKKLAKIPRYYTKEAIVFLTQYDIIKKVNEDRKTFGRALPDHILESMVKNFDISTIESEGFDKVTKITRSV